MLSERESFLHVLCCAGECTDIAVRNMAQLLFSLVLNKVLELNVPYREEIEVLYTKLLLKPLELLDQKIGNAIAGGAIPAGALPGASPSSAGASPSDKDKM